MSKVKVVLNLPAVGALLKSQEVANCVEREAKIIQGRAGDGYETDVYKASSRVISSVYTENYKAMKDNMKNNTLLKAVGR